MQALGYKLLKANLPVNGKLADGSVVTLKRFFSVPVEFDDKLVLMNIFSLENSPREFTFGADFIKKFQINMSYKKDGWSVRTEKIIYDDKIIDSHELNPNQKSQLSNIVKKFNRLCTGILGEFIRTYNRYR